MMWRMVATSLLAVALAACGSGGNGNDGYGKKSKGFLWGPATLRIFDGIPGGNSLRRQASRYGALDLVGEIEDYSSSQQEGRVPNPPQDIRFMGISGRYLDVIDLVTLRSNFPKGDGPIGHTVRASDQPLEEGQYMFINMEFEGNVPITNSSLTLDYSVVFKRTPDEADDWQGTAQFDRDTFIDSDYWVQTIKQAGIDPFLKVSEIDGTDITEVESQAWSIFTENAMMVIIPMSEFPERNTYAPVRGTAFDNIDGNFGFGNPNGFSIDTVPSRDDPYATVNASGTARGEPEILLDVKFVDTRIDMFSELGISRDQAWLLEQDVNGTPGVQNGNQGDFAGEANVFGGAQNVHTLYAGNAPAGGFLPNVTDPNQARGDIGVFTTIPGDWDVPFVVNDGDKKEVSGITFNTNIPTFFGTGSPTGEVLGGIIPSLELEAALAALEQASQTQILAEPKITTLNGQSLNVLGIDWTTPIDNTNPPVQNFFQTVDPNIQEGRTGFSLTVIPHVVPGTDRIELTVVPTRTVEADVQDIQVEGLNMKVTLPFVEKQDVSTRIMVRNGETVVIGGFIQNAQTQIQEGVPWLSSIPIVNFLFASSERDTQRENLLIFITPRILKD